MLGSPESGGQRIGDGEEPTTIAPIALGGQATAIASGNFSSCAILENGSVRCWGDNGQGQLGYGNTDDVGDDETPASVGPVDLGAGRTATAVTVGRYHACAILDTGDVRCWGDGNAMPGTSEDIGDDELPSTAPVVNLGGNKAVAISAGQSATCAVVESGDVWCWGNGPTARYSTGENRSLNSPEQMDIGTRTASSITLGFDHACIVFNDATIACWGESGSAGANDGRIGYPSLLTLGNMDGFLGNGTVATPEPPLLGGTIDVGAGRTVLTASAGDKTTCALLDNLTVRCWGTGPIVGQGITTVVGDDETPGSPRDQLQRDRGVHAAVAGPDPRHPPGHTAPAGSPKGIVAPGGSVDVQVTGQGGVPDTGVYAVVLNVTIAQSTGRGFVTAYPKGTSHPTASNINVTGRARALQLGDRAGRRRRQGDDLHLRRRPPARRRVRLLRTDRLGDRRPPHRRVPSRIFDTRPEKPTRAQGQGRPDGTIEITVTGTNGVPSTGVSAVVLNVTAAKATARGFVTVYPGDEEPPATSNLNLTRPANRPNTVIVPVSPTGTIKLYSKSGAHLLADVSGYFTDATAPDTDDGLFVPLVPARLLDTRDDGPPIPPAAPRTSP